MTRLSICICTSGRPAELERCLASIESGSRLPYEVLVSDDSRDDSLAGEVRAVCERFSFVHYLTGPRRGLCANRNNVVRQARGEHMALLDDDAIAGPEFVEHAAERAESRPDVIWTGDVLEDGTRRQRPTNPTFLGHFGRPPRPGEPLVNVNLNCNVFPAATLRAVRFDESIEYGYEDADLCAQLVDTGWRIQYCSDLVNHHCPPEKGREQLRRQSLGAETARGRVQVRMRRRRGRIAAAFGWSVAAAAHAAVSAGRHVDPARLGAVMNGIRLGWSGVARS